MGARRSRSPRRTAVPGLPIDAAHAEVFDIEEFLDAVFHAAEGRDLGRDDALVDADDAVFERLGDAPDAADVAAVEIGGEPCRLFGNCGCRPGSGRGFATNWPSAV